MTNIQTNRSAAESPAAIFPSHRVMKLALVAPLPPCPSPWAPVVTALIPQFDGTIEDEEINLGVPKAGRKSWAQLR